jgi:cell wall-associated NlpC family hydrolase
MDRVACTHEQPGRIESRPKERPGRWLITAGAVALSAWSAACASTGAVPRPFPTPGGSAARVPAPEPAPAAPPESLPVQAPIPSPRPAPDPAPPLHSALDGYALAGTALALRGTPYRNGGTDPSGFDCSGFTQYVFAQYGVNLPREVREQYRVGTPVNPEDLVAGDVVFFATTDPGPSHVAIVIGGDQFVHAPSSTGVVRVEHLSSSYWAPRYLGARRMN